MGRELESILELMAMLVNLIPIKQDMFYDIAKEITVNTYLLSSYDFLCSENN